ncbi:MAG: hypothetical protein M1130_11405 [Actinobacteria bacterium]|nr:hypothetical protein [Actinomycetota bacterium]
MKGLLASLHRDQGGSVFVEMALLIIGVVFVVASHMNQLGSSLGSKIDDIKTEVEQVGN